MDRTRPRGSCIVLLIVLALTSYTVGQEIKSEVVSAFVGGGFSLWRDLLHDSRSAHWSCYPQIKVRPDRGEFPHGIRARQPRRGRDLPWLHNDYRQRLGFNVVRAIRWT